MPAPSDVEFVPMIWGKDNVTAATLAKAKREGRVPCYLIFRRR